MEYLTAKDILFIHSAIIDETGGSHGVRDMHFLESLEAQPQQAVFGKELYPSIFLKAAVYIFTIVTTHPFVDGNKRTGMTTGIVFLGNNNIDFNAQEGEIEHFAVSIVEQRLSREAIAEWLKAHCQKENKKAA
jgi:death on curing protein